MFAAICYAAGQISYKLFRIIDKNLLLSNSVSVREIADETADVGDLGEYGLHRDSEFVWPSRRTRNSTSLYGFSRSPLCKGVL